MKKLTVLKNKFPPGTRTGKLVVKGYEKYGKPPYFWMLVCRCDCGNIIRERPHRLMARTVKSCGCSFAGCATDRFKSTYPTGLKFGQLTVIGYDIKPFETAQRNGSTVERRVICVCACGKKKSIAVKSLKCGGTISCGCVGIKNRVAAAKRAWSLPPGTASFNAVYGQVKRQAVNRGIAWVLTPDEFKRVVAEKCFYCGAPPSKSYRTRTSIVDFVYNGIDRLDSGSGYTVSNCVPACKVCNYAKNTMSVDEFKTWIRNISAHFLGLR